MSNKFRTIIVFATVFLFIINSACAISNEKLYTTKSPNEKMKVEIIQKNFLIKNRVYLNAYINDKQIVNEKLFYSGDFFDDNFMDKYPNYNWDTDSILRIGNNDTKLDGNIKTIKITNASSEKINYLLIETAGNKVVLFDFQPNSVNELHFPVIEWLSCQGQFAETRERFGDAAKILESKKANQIEILIKDEVEIKSPHAGLEKIDCCAPDRDRFDRENDSF